MEYQKYLTNYARLILKIGLNLQENQELYIDTTDETVDLVEEIIKLAYQEFKSGKVTVKTVNDQVKRAQYLYADTEILKQVNKEDITALEEQLRKNAARLFLIAPNPTLLQGVDSKKISTVSKEFQTLYKPIRSEMDRQSQTWCIAAYVGNAWAKQVFKDLDINLAKEKLWDLVIKATRLDLPDPIKAWEEHIINCTKRATFLNELDVKTFHYKSSITDLYVDMPNNYLFNSAADLANFNKTYTPNIPTEEVFATPTKYGTRGRLHSTMPLNLSGNLVDDFYFDFEDGKIINFDAKVGYDFLKELIETDEGAKYLGEIALVPVDSPISNLNTLFYNTLFDENASCHFAIGMGFGSAVKDALTKSSKEQEELGINQSIVHVDFMVGSSDLDITAITKDGKEVMIFKDGNWAF